MRLVPQESAGLAGALRLRRTRARRRVPLFGWLMALPAIVVLLAVTVYPLVYSLRKSFYRIELTFSPVPEFVGVHNYVDAIARDPRFWHAMERSLYLVGVGVTVELLLGLGLAHILNGIGRGRNVATALMLVPAMIAPVAVAIEGVVIFNDRWGPLNYVLKQSGVPHPPAWLADRSFALNTILLADIWQWTPFVAVIMLAGLRTLPGDVYEAAAVDGASRWQVLRTLTLPLLQPLIIVTVLIRAMDVFKTFDTVYVMTGGGPGDATETASFYTFLQGLRFFSFGYAAAISFIQLVIISIVATILIRRMRKGLTA
jgi:multiple sugar transport system permease protein